MTRRDGGVRPVGTLLLASVVMLAVDPGGVFAQRARAELTGVAVSTTTREPIAGAWIALQGWEYGTYSRGDGRFKLPDMPGGARMYDVAALGYLPSTMRLDPTTGDVVIELEPNDSLLAGLAFVFQHLESRRRGGRVFDQESLAFSGTYDLAEFLTLRGVRGVRRFCIDERYDPPLEAAPPGDFYLMEIHGGTARLYTEEFIERMAGESPDEVRRVIRRDQPFC